jgi:hypothetical protein
MSTNCTPSPALLGEAQTKAARKLEQLHARLEVYTGEDLEELLEKARGAMHGAEWESTDRARRNLAAAMHSARLALEGAMETIRGCEADMPRLLPGRWRSAYQEFTRCRRQVSKLEAEVIHLREYLEPIAHRAGHRISAGWPKEET